MARASALAVSRTSVALHAIGDRPNQLRYHGACGNLFDQIRTFAVYDQKAKHMRHNPTYGFKIGAGEERLRELILYVASRCQRDSKFGATKLNKILWWSDFIAYAELGHPITGVEYMRLGKGPVPKRLVPIREDMESRREIAVSQVKVGFGDYTQKRIVPLRSPKLDIFSAPEIELVNRVIDALWSKTAAGVSALSHGKAWEVADDHGPIPYEAVFLSDDKVNRYDVGRTKELARQFGWTTL
jgi:hypothetical protein